MVRSFEKKLPLLFTRISPVFLLRFEQNMWDSLTAGNYLSSPAVYIFLSLLVYKWEHFKNAYAFWVGKKCPWIQLRENGRLQFDRWRVGEAFHPDSVATTTKHPLKVMFFGTIFTSPSQSSSPSMEQSRRKPIKRRWAGIIKVAKKVWRAITPEYLKNLYKSMTRRTAAVIAAGGRHTKY